MTKNVQPFNTGDTMTRDEFMRRYEQMPDVWAELIDGVVFVGPPVRYDLHAHPVCFAIYWLGCYRSHTPGLRVGSRSTVFLSDRSVPQPDLLLAVPERSGGQTRLTPDGYVAGAPEFVVEVSAVTTEYDTDVKRRVYCAAGVNEYLVWRTADDAFDWFARDGDGPLALRPVADEYRSRVFPGLVLSCAALRALDAGAIQNAVDAAVAADPDHAAFVRRLADE